MQDWHNRHYYLPEPHPCTFNRLCAFPACCERGPFALRCRVRTLKNPLLARHWLTAAVALGHDGIDDLLCDVGIFDERFLGGFLALADQFAVELEPSALLVDGTLFDADIQNAPFLVDAMIVNDIELGL